MQFTKISSHRCNTDEAIFYLLEPNIESEFEGLDDSDEELEPNVAPPRIEEKSTEAAEEEIEDDFDRNDQSGVPEVDTPEDESPSSDNTQLSFSDHVFCWRLMAAPQSASDVERSEFGLAPANADEMTPLNYFEMFWKSSLYEHIAQQTNLYAMQKDCAAVSSSKGEIEQFIGMQMLMSVVQLPKYEIYWAKETRYAPIADVIGRNRYKPLRRYLYVNDNSLLEGETNKKNKLFTIQPVIDHVKFNRREIQPEKGQSIDEQIIPAKTAYSGIRQYNPKKPKKWGFKSFVRSGSSVYDFFFYQGSSTADSQKCTGSYAVLRLIEKLPKNQNFKLFFDN